jgi:uncharacterized protein YjbI with pentapeptide repeats
LGILILIIAGVWFWGILVGYINPGTKGATDRKDVVQAFALILAGVVATIGGIVGVVNLQTSRHSLQQQRDLEEQRAQEDALQSYFEQMGDLLTAHNLISTDREDIRQLAKAQTQTVLARLDGHRKGALLRFLHQAGLISTHRTIVGLSGADLHGADLHGANLSEANLSGANLGFYITDTTTLGWQSQHTDLSRANLNEANLSMAGLLKTDLSLAELREANLSGARFTNTNLYHAKFTTEKQLERAHIFPGTTMPNGQDYEDWIEYRR